MPAPGDDPARRDLRPVLAALGGQKGRLVCGVACGLLWTAAKVSVPLLVAAAVDKGILAGRTGALVRFAGLIALAGVVQGTTTGLRRYLAFSVAYRVETELRGRLFAHLQRLHFAFHDAAETGQLMARSASDLQQITNLLVNLPITVANACTVLAVAAVLLVTNPLLGALALGVLPALTLLAAGFSRRLYPRSLALQAALSQLSAVVEETVSGIRVVKGLGAEALRSARLAAAAGEVYDKGLEVARLRSRFGPVLDVLPQLGTLAVLAFGGHEVLEGRLAIGQLLAAAAYVVMLVVPLRSIGWVVVLAERALASAHRLGEVLSTTPVIVDPPRPRPLPRGGGELRFERVRFGYEARRPVLDGFELVVEAGEAVALVGRSGSGKTTVARLVPRFYDVWEGRVVLDGVDVRELRLSQLRRAVGIVFEDTFLFSDTIAANIAFAQPDADLGRIRAAAAAAGADEFISSLPDGYETVIGSRGLSLSGGQRQRIALARAILADPRVLVLDDATSAVDAAKEHEILDALRTVMAGRTTLLIAHRPATVALADRVVLIEHGKVAAEGTHAKLAATSGLYRDLLALPEPGALFRGSA